LPEEVDIEKAQKAHSIALAIYQSTSLESQHVQEYALQIRKYMNPGPLRARTDVAEAAISGRAAVPSDSGKHLTSELEEGESLFLCSTLNSLGA
jgi:hypothetical protein